MGLLSRLNAAKSATATATATTATATATAPVINTPIAETPAPAPAAETPAPVATATPAPAPAPKKEWTPQENAQRIIDAVTAGSITLTDTMDGEHAAYLINGKTEKIKVAAKALGGRIYTKTGEGENAKYTWILRKDYIDNPETGAAVAAERKANKDARRAEKAAKAAQTPAPTATPQAAAPAAPTDKVITITEDALTAIISKTVSQTIATLKAQGFLVTPSMTVTAATGTDDDMPF